MTDGDAVPFMLRVTDVKQFVYCPRIPFFTYVLPVPRRATRKMEYGLEEHADLDRLEKRRQLSRYQLDHGERQFHVPLMSSRLGVSGVLDMLIRTPAGAFPVEFKFTSGPPALNHKYQLLTYALLVEDQLQTTVRNGFLYLVPGKRIQPVFLTPTARQRCHRLMRSIRKTIASERMPPPPARHSRCRECEFRLYCGDV